MIEKFSHYIQINFKTNSHFEIAVKVFELLSYIKGNVGEVTAIVGKKHLFRHPTNHLAVHLDAYTNEDDAKKDLLDLVEEVEGSLTELLEMEEGSLKHSVIDIYLLNINDSDTGCMEVRLRPALRFHAIFKSYGGKALPLNELMQQFNVKVKKPGEPTVEEILDHFAELVKYRFPIQMPVNNREVSIQSLSWEIIKDYCREVLCLEDIDKEWMLYGSELHSRYASVLSIVIGKRSVFFNFEDTTAKSAKHCLTYIRSIMPSKQEELKKAEVKKDEMRGVFCFKLRHDQYIIFQHVLGNNEIKVGEENFRKSIAVGEIEIEAEVKTKENFLSDDENNIFNFDCKLFRTTSEDWYGLGFKKKENRDEIFKKLLSILGEGSFIGKNKFLYYNKNSDFPFGISLNTEHWLRLRELIRKRARQDLPKDDYCIKSLRTDQLCFIEEFIKTVIPPIEKKTIRHDPKRYFTVTGLGIFSRTPETAGKYPLKPPQYTKKQKDGYSKAQSTSLGTPDFSPLLFGFSKERRDKLVGVIFLLEECVLVTDRVYLYDGGTVERPYEHSKIEAAEEYAKKIGKVLFPKNRLGEFKKLIKQQPKRYNEVLARLRFKADNQNSYIFVGSDTLEARLLAQESARLMKERLLESGLCDNNYSPKIVFYIPKSKLHFKEYTQLEQHMDKLEARSIYESEKARKIKFDEENYEFLLSLPVNKIPRIFERNFKGVNLIVRMIFQGYLHIVRWLLDKVDDETKKQLLENIEKKLEKEKNSSLLADALYYSVNTNYSEFTAIISRVIQKGDKVVFKEDKNPLEAVIKKGNLDLLRVLKNYSKIDFNVKFPVNGKTPLCYAASLGLQPMLEILLDCPNIDINMPDRYEQTPLYWAAFRGDFAVTHKLLERKAKVNATDINDNTALHAASLNGHVEIVRELLKQEHIPLNDQNGERETPLFNAVQNGHVKIIQLLLSCEGINIELPNEFGYSPLHWAALSGKVDIVRELLQYQKSPVAINSTCSEKRTPLFSAVVNNHIEIIKLFLEKKETVVNCMDKKNNSPVGVAIEKKYDKAAILLIQAGAIVDLNNNKHFNFMKHLLNDEENKLILKNYIINAYLPTYIERQREESGNGYWHEFFVGVSKGEKIAAVNCLQRKLGNISLNDFQTHQLAFSDGEVGRIYELLAGCCHLTFERSRIPVPILKHFVNTAK